MKVCAIMAPYYGETRTTALRDLAAQTGGRVVGEEAGHHARRARRWRIWGAPSRSSSTRRRRPSSAAPPTRRSCEARAHEIRALYADTNSTFRHQQLEERLRRLVGGAAVIRVGGTTEAEARERKLRIEDALFATRAAIAEGIVPGGGVALLRAADVLAKPAKDMPEEQQAPASRSCGGRARSRAARSPRTPAGTRR